MKKFGWAYMNLVGTRCSASVLGFRPRARSSASLPVEFAPSSRGTEAFGSAKAVSLPASRILHD